MRTLYLTLAILAAPLASSVADDASFYIKEVDAPMADLRAAIEKANPALIGHVALPTAKPSPTEHAYRLSIVCPMAPSQFLTILPMLPPRSVSDIPTEAPPVRVSNVKANGKMIDFDFDCRYEDGRLVSTTYSTSPAMGVCIALPDSKRPEGYRVFVILPK